MSSVKLFLCGFILLFQTILFSSSINSTDEFISKTELADKLADKVVEQFKQLLEYNHQNELKGETHKNKYILRYMPGASFNTSNGGVDFIQQHTFNNIDWDFKWPDENNNNEFDIEEELCAFNTNATQTNIFDIQKYAIIFGAPKNYFNTAVTKDITLQPAIVPYMKGADALSSKKLFFDVEALIESKIRTDQDGSAIDGAKEKIITISSYLRYDKPHSDEIYHETRTKTFYLLTSNLTNNLFDAYLAECNLVDGPHSTEKYTGRFYQRIKGFLNFFSDPVNFDKPFDVCPYSYNFILPNEIKSCYCSNASTLPQQQFLAEVCDFIDDNHFYTTGSPALNGEIKPGFHCQTPQNTWINTVFNEFKSYETTYPGSDGSDWILKEKIMKPSVGNVTKENLLFWFAKASLVDFQNLSKQERFKLIKVCKDKYPNGTSHIYTDNTLVTMTKKLHEIIFNATYMDISEMVDFLELLKNETGLLQWLFHEVCGNTWIDFDNEHDEHQVISAINKVVEQINGGPPDNSFLDKIELHLTDWGDSGVIWKPTPWWWNFDFHYKYDNIGVDADSKVKFRQRFINKSNDSHPLFKDTIWNYTDPFIQVPVGGGQGVTWATDCHNGKNAIIGCGKVARVPAISLAWYMDKMNAGQKFDALVTAAELITIPIGGAQLFALTKVAGTSVKVLRARKVLYGFALTAQTADLTLPNIGAFVAASALGVSGPRAIEIKADIKEITGILATIGGVLEITDLFTGLYKYSRVSKARSGLIEKDVDLIFTDVQNMLIEYPEYTAKLCQKMGITNHAAVAKVTALNNVDQRIALMGAINQTSEIRALVNANENLADFFIATLNIGVDPSIHKLLLGLGDVKYLKLIEDLKGSNDLIAAMINDLELLKAWEKLLIKNVPNGLRFNIKFLNRLKDNSKLINLVDNLTGSGKIDFANNMDLWVKRYDARHALKNENYNAAINILEGTPGTPKNYNGANYVGGLFDPPDFTDIAYATPASLQAIINSTNDVSAIANKLGINPNLVQAVKHHLFIKEHLVETTSEVYTLGRFNTFHHITQWWNSAVDGTISNADAISFRRLLGHEYIESALMQQGLIYRQLNVPSGGKYGAHELSLGELTGDFTHWTNSVNGLDRIPPIFNLKADFSNIDNVVDQIKVIEGL